MPKNPFFPLALAFLALFLSPPFTARAAVPQELQHYELGAAQGLRSDSVSCILQDTKGLIWLGGYGGLSRFDGHSFTAIGPHEGEESLASSRILALEEDGSGCIWIGTDGGGLARYDPASDSFSTFRAASPGGGGLSSDRIAALDQDSLGRILVGTMEGVLERWDASKGRFEAIFGSDPGSRTPISAILVDYLGRIWLGTGGGGLILLDGDGRLHARFRHEAGRMSSIGSDRVTSLLEDSLGNVWVGLGEGGVDLLSGTGFRHAVLPAGNAMEAQAVKALAEDPEGRIWVGLERSGLASLNPSSLALVLPPPGEEGRVLAISRDRGGIMWVGLEYGGARAYNIRSSQFTRYTKLADGRPLRDLRGLAQGPGGLVYAGTDGLGLLAFDPGRGGEARPFGEVRPPRGRGRFPARISSLMMAKDGSLWMGSAGEGLAILGKDGSLRTYRHAASDPSSLGDDSVTALLEGSDGRIWVGTEGGLDLLEAGSGAFRHFRSEPDGRGSLGGSSVLCLLEDSAARIWVGTRDGGLSRLDPSSSSFASFPPQPSLPGGLGDACINCVFQDSAGGIWLGTGGGGLVALDPIAMRFTRVGKAEDLIGDTVYGIVEDRSGILWISGSSGLVGYDRRMGHFFLFGPEDGLASADFCRNSFLAAGDGELWFGGTAGMTRFDPQKVSRYAPQPDVVLAGLDFPGGKPPLSRSPDGGRIVLAPGNGGLSFRIAVIDYGAPTRNRFAMRLEGRQEGWTYLGTSNSGNLAPLSPGSYLLRVKGSNGNGVWNQYGASLSIVVEPPFQSTWVFRALVAAFLALAIGAMAGVRIRSLHRRNALLVKFARHIEAAREEERKEAAREVHEGIGQRLTVLNFHAYWLASHRDAEEAASLSRIEEMQATILDTMAEVKAIATRLRPVALDALGFTGALRWYVRSFERISGVRATMELTEGIVAGAAATCLFRVLQEMLTNVMRHAKASRVTVSLRNEDGRVVLETRDDGLGIEAGRAEAGDSFGILGMSEACAALGGSFEIHPGEDGKGTVARASLPLEGDRKA